jgi:hypothetical protein
MAKPKKPNPGPLSDDGATSTLVIRRGPYLYEIPRLRATYDFKCLAKIFPRVFGMAAASAIARSFAKYSDRYNKAKIHAWSEFAKFVESSDKYLAQLNESAKSGRISSATTLNRIMSKWFDARREKYYPAQATTLAEVLNAFRAVFRPLHQSGLVVGVKFPVMPENYHVHGSHKPSLVETGKRDRLCAEIVTEMRRLAAEMGMEPTDDAAGYIAGLAEAIPLSKFPNVEVFRTAIQRENWKRLQTIRSVAELAVKNAMQLFEEGEALLVRADPHVARDMQRALYKTREKRTTAMAKIFPRDDPVQSTANLLKYCVDMHGGRVPLHTEFYKPKATVVMMHLYRRLGGRRRIVSMLGGDPSGIAGVGLLYLVDSGANVATAIELTPHCIEPTDDPNKVKVVSEKARSGWQPIVDTFDIVDASVKVTVPQALAFAIRATERIRKLFPEFANTLLSFYWFSEAPSAAGFEFLSGRLNYFLRDAGEKVAREMLPSSIRQSYLTDRTLAADGKTRPAEILAKHQERNGTTTPIYTSRFPVKLIFAAKIRTFQTVLETDLIFNGLKLDEALGRTRAEGLEMLAMAERTGNGLRCRNSKAGDGPTSHVGQTCEDAGPSCIDCKQRLIMVDEDTIEDAVRTKARLEQRMDELEAIAPAKWEAEFMLELAFATAFIEKLSRSPYASLLRRVQKKCNAEKEADE